MSPDSVRDARPYCRLARLACRACWQSIACYAAGRHGLFASAQTAPGGILKMAGRDRGGAGGELALPPGSVPGSPPLVGAAQAGTGLQPSSTGVPSMSEINSNPAITTVPRESLGSEIKNLVSEAEDRARRIGQTAVDEVAATRAAISESACHAAAVTQQFVRGNPWTIVGIAAATGLIVGAILSRR
jgi:ElaB/YqjD/DUF883 family membrane-anchored ribosome-binding protein